MSARPTLEFFIVAESHAIDTETGRLSIFNVLDSLASSGKTAALPRFTALSGWLLDPECMGQEFMATLVVRSPTGQVAQSLKLAFEGTSRRHRLVHNVLGATFDEAGEWEFELLLDGKHSASHRVEVKLNKAGLAKNMNVSPWKEAKPEGDAG